MEININHIAKHVENFLNTIFVPKIIIRIQNNSYVINGSYENVAYEFWNKNDEELLNDFSELKFCEDTIGTIFFFLSGYWEFIHQSDLDEHGRFKSVNSFAYKKGILDEPVVDILVAQICEKLSLTYKLDDDRARVFLTHDIDFLGMFNDSRFYKSLCGDIVKRKDPIIAVSKLMKMIKKDDPYSVEKLIELNDKHKAKATYFFMSDVQPFNTHGGYDAKKYTEELMDLKSKIVKNESSHGIHYDSRYLVTDRMIADITKLSKIMGERIFCGRAHYLLFNIRKSFDIYESSGIKLDSTGGYADSIGFRFGTSYPFKPYNFKENREYDFIEVPLIVMDTTLKGENYMKLTPYEGLEIIKTMIDKTNEYKGVFTVLWHNTSFYSNGWNKWEFVYEEMLNYLNSINSKFLSANEIIKNEMIE